MAGDYHGWDQQGDRWCFAETVGRPKNESVFVVEDFGESTSPRQALSAIMSAMAQFKVRIQVVQSDRNTRLIKKLNEASLLRFAEIKVGDHAQWGILGVQANQPSPKRSKWKFWAS